MLYGRQEVSRPIGSLPVLRVHPGPTILARLRGDVAFIETHYFGRELICGGDGCPACDIQQARLRGYCVGDYEQGRGNWRPCIIEASLTSWDRLQSLATMVGLGMKRGLVVEATRPKRKSPLVLDPLELVEVADENARVQMQLAVSTASLFGLPLPQPTETIPAWASRVHTSVIHKLQSAVKAV